MSNLVPVVIEQTSRGERSFDLFWRLLAGRIIFLGTQVDDTSANLILSRGPLSMWRSSGSHHRRPTAPVPWPP